MPQLGVNIDHVATIRQARGTNEPDPVWAAVQAELGGADCITIHLREDRRHIQDRDLRVLQETVKVRLNLEMACVTEIIQTACNTCPSQVTLVPERREEVTTEGGLDLLSDPRGASEAVKRLRDAGILVSLFLDPDPKQIDLAGKMGADSIELHTGRYAVAAEREPGGGSELARLESAGRQIIALGMDLLAGHGLTYRNVLPVARISQMKELNIGHSIVSRSIFVGMEAAVRAMKQLISVGK